MTDTKFAQGDSAMPDSSYELVTTGNQYDKTRILQNKAKLPDTLGSETFLLYNFVSSVMDEINSIKDLKLKSQEYSFEDSRILDIYEANKYIVLKNHSKLSFETVNMVLKTLFSDMTYNSNYCAFLEELLEQNHIFLTFRCDCLNDGCFECKKFTVSFITEMTTTTSATDFDAYLLNESSIANNVTKSLVFHLNYLHIVPKQEIIENVFTQEEQLILENEKFIHSFISSKASNFKVKEPLNVESPPPNAIKLFLGFLALLVTVPLLIVLFAVPILCGLALTVCILPFVAISAVLNNHHFLKLLNSEHYKNYIDTELENNQLYIRLFYRKNLSGKNYCRKFVLYRPVKDSIRIRLTAPNAVSSSAVENLSLRDKEKIHTFVNLINAEISANCFKSDAGFVFKKTGFLNQHISLWHIDSNKYSFIANTNIPTNLFDDVLLMLDSNHVGCNASFENNKSLIEAASFYQFIIDEYIPSEKEIHVHW